MTVKWKENNIFPAHKHTHAHEWERILCWFWQLKCGGVGGLKLEEFQPQISRHTKRGHIFRWDSFAFRFCVFVCCVLCVFLSVYLDFVPGNWLWPPEGYSLRIKVEIYTYKCHTSPGLCITKQQRKKGDRKQKTKQISAYFGIDFGRDMCHIHTASIRIPKNKLLKRLCHAEGKIKEENERKILFSFCALCHPFIVAAFSWSGGDPLFCLATAFNAMFLGMFWLWLVASCLWWILRHVTFYVLHPHAPAWSSHLKKVGSTANFMPGKKCDNHTRGAIHNN